MVDASNDQPVHSTIETARLRAKMAINFRIAKRIIELSEHMLTNEEKRSNVQFKRNLARFTQDQEFREAMREYIYMGHSVENLESRLHGIIPQELIQHIVEYGRRLPKTGGGKTRKYRKKENKSRKYRKN